MLRIILWVLAALFLVLVGMWPTAAVPIGLAATGATVILAAIPGPVLLLIAVVAWFKYVRASEVAA